MKLRSVRTVDPVRTAVRVASVGNVSFASPPSAIDGVTLAAGDRVLLKEQTVATQNGVYEAGVGLARDGSPTDVGQLGQALGQVVFVAEGDVNAGQAFIVADLSDDPVRFDPVVPVHRLADWYSDVSTTHNDGTEDTLYSFTVPAGRLCRDGDKLVGVWAGEFASTTASPRRLRLRFAGTTILDTFPVTIAASNWRIETTIIREASGVVRCTTAVGIGGGSINVTAPQYLRLATGVDLSAATELRLTGTVSSGGTAGDIVAHLGTLAWQAAAPST